MRFRIIIFFLMLMVLPVFAAQAMRVETIAVVVNEEVITTSDVQDRMQLIINSSGLQNRKDIQDRLRPQVVEELVSEQLKFQEAQRYEVTVSDEEIEQGFSMIARQNNVDPDDFKSKVEKSGVNVQTMYRQIRAQLSWNKVVQRVLRSRVNVTDNDVEAYLERVGNAIGKKEFLVAEIFLPVDGAKNESNARQLGNRLIGEIRAGKAPFSRVAQQFSKAAGSSNGGDLGWIQEGQLDDDLDQELIKMKKGELSNPIRSAGGYHIFLVRDTRQITEESMPEEQEIRNQIGLDRLDKLQQGYLFDLKAEAFIEYRAGS